MAIYSSTYSADAMSRNALDTRDFGSMSFGGGASSGWGGMSASGWGAVGGMVVDGIRAYGAYAQAKGQARMGRMQHDFAMKTAGWQNQMIGLQRQAIGIQAKGQILQAKSQQLQAQTQAAIARINARLAESAAQGTLHSGARQEQAKRLETAAFKSKQRVGFASSGVDMSSESVVRVLTSTDIVGDIDANTIAANAIRTAWGYRTEAVNQRGQAGMMEANGQMAAAVGRSNAAATLAGMPSTVTLPVASRPISEKDAGRISLLGSATQMATTFYSLSKQGAFN